MNIGRGVNIGCDRCFHMTDVFTIYSKNTDESLDECRQVQTNVDEPQMNVDEYRRA